MQLAQSIKVGLNVRFCLPRSQMIQQGPLRLLFSFLDPKTPSELTHWKRPCFWERLKAGRKGTTEDEMVGWHHRLNGHEFEQTWGDDDGQGGLACCSLWGRKEKGTTERLNNISHHGRSGPLSSPSTSGESAGTSVPPGHTGRKEDRTASGHLLLIHTLAGTAGTVAQPQFKRHRRLGKETNRVTGRRMQIKSFQKCYSVPIKATTQPCPSHRIRILH